MAFGAPMIQLFNTDPSLPGATAIAFTMTDHNRGPLDFAYENIESAARMANGQMRKYVVGQKRKISTDWKQVPAAGGRNFTADGNLGAAALKNFYEQNAFTPVWIKLTYAKEDYKFSSSIPTSSQGTRGNENITFNSTHDNWSQTPIVQYISGASVGAFTGASATASISVTNFPYYGASAGQEVVIRGVDQIFNGSWIINSIVGNTFTFTFSASGYNAPAAFTINSYQQSGNTITMYTDTNDWAKVGASVTISNTKPYSGSTINGAWVLTGTQGTTVVTASSGTSSQTAIGTYGQGTIISSSSWVKTINALFPATVGAAVSPDIIKTYITNFTYRITNRLTLTDYVDMTIEFTEV